MSVLVVCPTRGRPDEFRRMCESVERTTNDVRVRGYVDDDQMNDYGPGWGERGQDGIPRFTYHVGPRIGPIAAANKIVEWNSGYDVYGFLTDDCEVTTSGWDQWLEEARESFRGRVGAMSPHLDGIEYMSFPFVTKEWLAVTGWLAYPKAYHFCWDTIIELLAEPIGLAHAPRERFRLTHPNHTSQNVMEHFERDARSFLFWVIRERRGLVRRLRVAQCA